MESDAMEQLEAHYRAEYQAMVSRTLLLTGSASRAEELAQEAFVRVAPKLGTADNPGGYLRTTLVNLCRDDGRRQLTAQRHQARPVGAAQAPPVPTDVGEVWQAIQTLSEPRRRALVLRYWADPVNSCAGASRKSSWTIPLRRMRGRSSVDASRPARRAP